MRLLLCGAILLALTTPAFARDIRVTSDPGGLVYQLYARYHSEYAGGMNRHVIDGYCGSSCTMRLHFANTCVTPRARFMFHHAHYWVLGYELTEPNATRYMLDKYPPKVRQWVQRNGGLRFDKLWLSSAGAKSLGVKAC